MAELLLRLHDGKTLDKDEVVLQDTVNALVQPHSSLTPEKAAQALDQTAERSEDMDYDFFTVLWWNIYSLAVMIPCNDPGLGKLAQLLVALSELPRTYDNGNLTWDRLPWAQAAAAEFWDKIYPHPTEDPSEEAMDKWINWNAFAARLPAAGLEGWGYEFGQTLQTFEYQDPHVYDIEAFGEWMKYAGAWIFDHSKEVPWGGEGAILRHYCGDFTGPPGLSRARWDYWKRKLGALVDGYDDETKQEIREIIDRMETIERDAQTIGGDPPHVAEGERRW